MSRDVRLFLQDIIDCCDKVTRFTAGLDFDAWVSDELR